DGSFSSLDPAAPNSAHELTALASGRRNSQCINMQKRCINCFISFRKLQYLNNEHTYQRTHTVIKHLNSIECQSK
uniref:Uncharacterized protein n=1 Tax=Cyanistes caeruleus TaxID=156563 RepID=A0A8C0U2N3_CYACU